MHYLYVVSVLVVCSYSWLLVFHVEDILGALERWNFKENLPADAHKKVCRKVSVYVSIILMLVLNSYKCVDDAGSVNVLVL